MRDFRVITALLVACLSGGGPANADGILVLGGTGELGIRIVKLLVEKNEDVTVFVRDSSDRSSLADLDVEYFVGDLLDQASVNAAFAHKPYRAVINAVRAPPEIVDFYRISNEHIVEAAKSRGIKQIIHHGAIGAGANMALHPDVPWNRLPYLQPRMMDHGVSEEVLFSSGIPITIIRNGQMWPNDTEPTGSAVLTEDRRVMTPITRADLARFTMECLDNPECSNKVYHHKDDLLSWPPPCDPLNPPSYPGARRCVVQTNISERQSAD